MGERRHFRAMKKFFPGKPGPAPEKDRAKRKRERIAIGIVAVLVAGLTILEARLGAARTA